MSDGNAILNSIVKNPDDVTGLLILADWLQENGAEGSAIRLRASVALATSSTLYMVTHGEYSDYSVDGVFSTREAAETWIKGSIYDYGDFEIEEVELDYGLTQLAKGLTPYRVVIRHDSGLGITGTAVERDKASITDDEAGTLYAYAFVTYTWAKDEEHAAKIANERRAVLVATQGTKK